MKKLFFISLILAMLCLVDCQNGVEVDSLNTANQETREIKLISATVNTDGSITYKHLLPFIWETGLNEKWDGIGIQINDNEIIPLYAAQNQLAYYWEYTTVNKDVFFRFGHYRYSGDQVIWANQNDSSSKYSIKNNGRCFGITFRNGEISRVNPASLILLQAIIDVDVREVRENGKIRFSASRSTGQASLSSKIIEYDWDFSDGETTQGIIVEHVFKIKGNYTVKLTVKDDLGNINTATVDIKVFKLAFPVNTLEGGDDYIQVSENRYAQTITIYVNLSLTRGNHGKPFWWGTINGMGTAWVFEKINPVPLNEDWGFIEVPFNGRRQFEFNYSDYYEYLNYDNKPVGVNWDHLPFSKFYDSNKGHYIILVANQKVSRPY